MRTAIVRSTGEAVLRELVAGRRFQEMLTTRRADLERDALDRLRRRIDALAEGGIGVALDGFTLHDLHPPPEVVNSYHAVAKAIQERDRVINEAEADALRQKRRAEEEADRVLKRAEAEAHSRREAAEADRDAFLAWHAVRNKLAPDEEAMLAAERERRVKAGESIASGGEGTVRGSATHAQPNGDSSSNSGSRSRRWWMCSRVATR